MTSFFPESAPLVPPTIISNKRWCIRTGERSMLQKSGKTTLQTASFARGRRKISGNKRNNVFFAGSGYRTRYRMIPATLALPSKSNHWIVCTGVAGAVAAGVGLTCTAEPDTAAGVTLGAGVPSFCKPPDCVSTLVRLPSLIRCG